MRLLNDLALVVGAVLGIALFVPIAVVLGFAKIISVIFDWLEDA